MQLGKLQNPAFYFCIVSQLSSLRVRLRETEAERDRLLAELEELRVGLVSGATCDSEDGEDLEDMLDFPGELNIS